MKSVYFSIIAIVFASGFCFAQDVDSKDYLPKKDELYFDELLVYEFREMKGDSITQEHTFEIYFNQQKQYFLLKPQDEMSDGVLSLPNGKYYAFYTGVHNDKVAYEYFVDEVNRFTHKIDTNYVSVKKTNIFSTLKDKYSPYKKIKSQEVHYNFLEYDRQQSIDVSSEYPIKNTYQIYGFANLPIEGKLPHYFNVINLIAKNVLVTKSEANYKEQNLGVYFKLTSFSYTSYYLQTKNYKFFKGITRENPKEKRIKNPFAIKTEK